MEEQRTNNKPLMSRKKGALGKVRGSWGVLQAWRYIRKNHWFNIGRPVTEKEFYAIVRQINLLIAEEIALGNTVTLPCRMGKLELRKLKVGAQFVDGKLKVTYPPNWSETLKLWYEDEEAKKRKIVLRHEQPYVYYVCYDKWRASYENKVFYRFSLNTFIKRKLSKNIKNNIVDTLW